MVSVLSDGLVKKMEELEQNANIYKGKFVWHACNFVSTCQMIVLSTEVQNGAIIY